jgi:hypothetical protein
MFAGDSEDGGPIDGHMFRFVLYSTQVDAIRNEYQRRGTLIFESEDTASVDFYQGDSLIANVEQDTIRTEWVATLFGSTDQIFEVSSAFTTASLPVILTSALE